MRKFMLLGLIFSISLAFGKEKTKQDPLTKPYNPFSLIMPAKELLVQMPVDRVLDMGASAYGHGFYGRALYFYTNVIELFPKDHTAVAWAHYETAYIYNKRFQREKALEHLDVILGMPQAPATVQALAQTLAIRIRNPKAYRVYLKQEDAVFLADKKAKSVLDKQIAKEEAAADKARRALQKERKKREKEERKALQAAQKAEQKARQKQAKEDEKLNKLSKESF